MNNLSQYASIPISLLKRYLRLQGWIEHTDFPNKKLIVFDGPVDLKGDRFHAVFPSDPTFADYPIRVMEMIRMLSDI
ncbi:MAG: hypothetical protein ACRC5C_01320, partial [Bacilli bacterium]